MPLFQLFSPPPAALASAKLPLIKSRAPPVEADSKTAVARQRFLSSLRPVAMKPTLLLLALLASMPFSAAADAPAPKSAEAIKRHPLRGVVTGIMADRSSLLVKHEEIPGVMRAMTMLFKVDAATLKAAKEGQTITGLMSRQGDAWVLENVKIVAEKKS
jgi:Cu/Ag efflux protein CusF